MKRHIFPVVAFTALVMAHPARGDHDGTGGHPMNNQQIGALLGELQAEIQGRDGFWYLEYQGHPTYVITDEAADRMRIVVQIAPSTDLEMDDLYRMMQANFDSALDARYAIARDVLWSAFIHPLSPLSDDDFRQGFLQAITLAETYGDSYSSGGLIFGGGDSGENQQ